MRIVYSKLAVKVLSRLDAATQKRIRAAIENLPEGDVKKLAGYSYTYRLRVGDWRILFEMQSNIVVDNIVTRGDAYKN